MVFDCIDSWYLHHSGICTIAFFAVITNAKMNVNCLESLFQISHANFLIVRYPTHFKVLSYIYFIKKTATPITLTYCVSGLYSLCQLTYYCVCNLEFASRQFLARSFNIPSFLAAMFFPIIHPHVLPLKADFHSKWLKTKIQSFKIYLNYRMHICMGF